MLIQKINNFKIVAYNLVCAKPWAFFCFEKTKILNNSNKNKMKSKMLLN